MVSPAQHNIEIEAFWRAYMTGLPVGHPHKGLPTPEAWGFGNTPRMADELGALVVQGVKTATSSLVWEYESDGEPIPKAGELSIILNGEGMPICLIETVEVEIKPFHAVGARHAFEEGEGDRSLAYWRDVHWRYFTPICAAAGRTPDESMPLVCERFRVVYKAQD